MKKDIDVKNQKFGKLTAIKINSVNKRGGSYCPFWLCQCECGNITEVSIYDLLYGNTKSCGCLSVETRRLKNDISGKRFDKLVVVELYKREIIYKKVKTYWLCRCDCGQEKILPRDSLISGNTKSCGCSQYQTKDPDLLVHDIYIRYVRSANKRNILFNIDKEFFAKLIIQNCYYCNRPPQQVYKSKKREFKYNGIDRLESSKGYELYNCVTCCKQCNYAKGKMNYKDFIDLINNIYKNLFVKNEIL